MVILKEEQGKNKKTNAPTLLAIIVLVSIVCLPFFSPQTFAATDWGVNITASLSTTPPYTADCVFGMKVGATNGFDKAFDQIVTPNPPAGINGWFAYPNDPVLTFQKISTSFISPSDPSLWTYKVVPISLGGIVTLSWSASEIATVPSNFNILLQDSSGTTTLTDMRSTNSYSYNSVADTTSTFIIVLIPIATSTSPSPSPTPTTTLTTNTTPTTAPTTQQTSNPAQTSTPLPSTTMATPTPSPTKTAAITTTQSPNPTQISSPSPSQISPLVSTPLYLYALAFTVILAITATILITIKKRR